MSQHTSKVPADAVIGISIRVKQANGRWRKYPELYLSKVGASVMVKVLPMLGLVFMSELAQDWLQKVTADLKSQVGVDLGVEKPKG